MIHSVFRHRLRKDDACILKVKFLPDGLEKREKRATEDAMAEGTCAKAQRHKIHG